MQCFIIRVFLKKFLPNKAGKLEEGSLIFLSKNGFPILNTMEKRIGMFIGVRTKKFGGSNHQTKLSE